MRVRKQTPANRLVAASICLLFLGVSASAFVASTVEPPELDDTPGRADTPGGPSTLNQAGSERGSVFSNSVFELNSGSPTLVLDNGTRVTFASTNNSSNPVYTADDIVSIAGSCAILDNYSLRCTGVNNYGQLGLGSFSLSNGTVDLGDRMAAAISDG
ncbi:MAG TPA: hypothetical protein EYM62_03785, partial [Candidatus Poseidoniales archaeon]|nr:hypothetical protein [Candidatus Poseidoniales archaeon]